MKVELYEIKVTDVERRILISALTVLKDRQKNEHKQYGFIDDLIVRACDVPKVKGKLNREER